MTDDTSRFTTRDSSDGQFVTTRDSSAGQFGQRRVHGGHRDTETRGRTSSRTVPEPTPTSNVDATQVPDATSGGGSSDSGSSDAGGTR
jgi:hypothetical protein